MTIRRKLISIILVACIAAIAVIAASLYSARTVNNSKEEELQNSLISSEISDLLLLTQEYLIQPSPRILKQRDITYALLRNQIAAIRSNNVTGQGMIDELASRLNIHKALFNRITTLNTTFPSTGSENAQQRLGQALIGRLLVESGRIGDLSRDINDFKRKELHAFQSRNSQLLVVFFMVNILLSIFIAYLVLRSIVRPIAILKKEARFISHGNFEHPVIISGNDEISELAHSLDEMRKSLHESTVSKHLLESHVVERTAELVEAMDEAEKANKAKSLFLSSMSHELRTPLNAILGFGQLLDMKFSKTSDIETQENIRDILAGGDHLLNLINEVLDLSRIETGHLVISLKPIALHQAITECISQIDIGMCRENNIVIINAVPDQDIEVVADPMRFKQVFINLLSNAVKYNKKGGSVTIKTDSLDRDRIRISITDTGNGIAATDMGKLFEPFERLSYKSSNIEGTGIGLTVTKKLVEAMDGSIGVESRVGEGSTFMVDLPLNTGIRWDEVSKMPPLKD